jgi:hypothetical protein
MMPVCAKRTALLVAALLLVPLLSGPGAAADGNDYEIPLSDLRKTEKKPPRKKERRNRREQSQDPASRTGAPAGEAPQAEHAASPKGDTAGASPVSPPSGAESAPLWIVHEPNSYLVAGKRTVIMAVVGGETAARAVYCRLTSPEAGGGDALVPMTAWEGSRYTYKAVVPAVVPGAHALRYRIVAVDPAGTETSSREFVVPVRQTAVVPGWQQEPDREPVTVELAEPDRPPRGFQDVTIKEVRKP